MLQNYFKIALRNLLKNKTLNFINIFGLALGIATCLTILLFVGDEWSYDRFHEKADQIVRVVFKGKMNGEIMKESVSMAPVAATFKQEFPEIVDATRMKAEWKPKITYQDKTFREGRFAYVDPNFFNVFTLPFISGESAIVLTKPNTIVLSKSMAERIFGTDEPIGKVLQFKDWEKEYVVTGVFENIPHNSHFHFDMFATTAGFPPAENNSWMGSEFFTYLQLQKNYDYKQLEAKLPAIVNKYMGPQLKQALGLSMDEFRAKGNDLGLFLQPLTDIHLRSDFANESESRGNIQTVYIFSVIALFMLLIACINFMNLSTANASKRAKEVGIRKVMGSQKKDLIVQFLSESFLTTFFAMLIAFAFLSLSIPIFNEISDKNLQISYLYHPKIIAALGVFFVVVSLIAGSYPSFILSSFEPIKVMKKITTSDKTGKNVRSGLVVFQFVISVVLIISTLIVNEQMNYIQNKNIGYDKKQLLVLRDTWMLGNREEIFKNELSKDTRIESITNSGFIPAGPTNNNMSGVFPAQNPEAVRRTVIYNVDENYIPTMKMEMAEGQNFSKDFVKNSEYVILNETAVKIFGLGENPIDKTLTEYTNNEGGQIKRSVIGVVKDFHFRSLHEPIAPLVMVYNPSPGLILRAKSGELASLLTDIKTKWETFNLEEPFQYGILDELFNETYIAEQKMVKVLQIFTLLTILVACLGLFGLVTFSAEQRTKEIGIRKVLGASTAGLVSLLSKDFLILVFASLVIAIPLAYYFMNRWLQDFAYRIDIHWSVFLLAGVMAVVVAFLTMSFQSVKAAIANPVKSLKSE